MIEITRTELETASMVLQAIAYKANNNIDDLRINGDDSEETEAIIEDWENCLNSIEPAISWLETQLETQQESRLETISKINDLHDELKKYREKESDSND